jgi:hypothetical protein
MVSLAQFLDAGDAEGAREVLHVDFVGPQRARALFCFDSQMSSSGM